MQKNEPKKGTEVNIDESYEPTYKELMRAKFDAEWEKLTPQMREFAEMSNNIGELYGWM